MKPGANRWWQTGNGIVEVGLFSAAHKFCNFVPVSVCRAAFFHFPRNRKGTVSNQPESVRERDGIQTKFTR